MCVCVCVCVSVFMCWAHVNTSPLLRGKKTCNAKQNTKDDDLFITRPVRSISINSKRVVIMAKMQVEILSPLNIRPAPRRPLNIRPAPCRMPT